MRAASLLISGSASNKVIAQRASKTQTPPHLSGVGRILTVGSLNRWIAEQRLVLHYDVEAFVLKVLGERPCCKIVHGKPRSSRSHSLKFTFSRDEPLLSFVKGCRIFVRRHRSR